MSNNWMTPNSEKLLQWEALLRQRAEKLRAEQPNLDDAALASMMEVDPTIAASYEEISKELVGRAVEQAIDRTCFIFGAGQKLIPDEELLRMSDRELAAWAQKTGVMLAQLKAHIAERFPQTAGKA
jgi:hypothetical protein